LKHLLPILSSPSSVPPTTGKIMKKVLSDLDFYLPFRQHAPSLTNARHQIYADIDFPGEDGAGIFNVLAFRGVFFGSPFAQSDRYRRFNSFEDWERFQAEGSEVAKMHGKDGDEEKYYVKRNCYGQSQTNRSTKLLSNYWDQRLLWSTTFNQLTMPTITEVHKWLQSSFPNIGALSALLICGDLIESGILPMPTADEWGGLIYTLKMGAKGGMETVGLITKQASKVEVAEAFKSLDLAIQQELTEEEKKAMDYNVIMLEHGLCKIKRLIARGIAMKVILHEI
jgi:hypothetical protein